MGGMTGLLLLLWAGVTVGSVVDLQKRILGGHNCLNTERLYHVQLKTAFPDEVFCGGSLISDKWILTAAHCWNLRLYAVVGVHPRTRKGNRMEVKPHFFWDDQYKKHDIMLLEIITPNPTPNKDQINYVKLPDNCNSRQEASRPTKVQIAGHIMTTVPDPVSKLKKSDDSDDLLCADTDVVKDCKDLESYLQKKYEAELWETIKHEHWLCYKRAGVDLSQGDSGGGVVDGGTIYGVIVRSKPFISKKVPAASMEVCKYRDWIDKTMNSKP